MKQFLILDRENFDFIFHLLNCVLRLILWIFGFSKNSLITFFESQIIEIMAIIKLGICKTQYLCICIVSVDHLNNLVQLFYGSLFLL
jgi:hypothetical protein